MRYRKRLSHIVVEAIQFTGNWEPLLKHFPGMKRLPLQPIPEMEDELFSFLGIGFEIRKGDYVVDLEGTPVRYRRTDFELFYEPLECPTVEEKYTELRNTVEDLCKFCEEVIESSCLGVNREDGSLGPREQEMFERISKVRNSMRVLEKP